jgi:hypothetical protein
VRLSSPFSLDVIAPSVALSASGAAAVGFGVEDADNPAHAIAYASWRSAGGQVSGPRPIPGGEAVLGVAFDGSSAVLLDAAGPSGQACCETVGVVRTGGAAFSRGQTLLGNLTGDAIGQLVANSGRVLAAFATTRGLWVAQTDKGGRFGRTNRLPAGNSSPEALQAAALPKGGAIVAWTETRPATHGSGPSSIFTASGSQNSAPTRSRTAVTLSGGRRVDELGVSAGSTVTTLAWTEDSIDSRGRYSSDVAVMDLGRHPTVTRYAVGGTVASGLSLAGDANGDQILAWKTCDYGAVNPTCAVRASLRTAGHGFGAPARIDAIDATESPIAAVSAQGTGMVGWIHAGHVVAAPWRSGSRSLGGRIVISHTTYAADLDLAFAPNGDGLAVWSQGTLAPDVVGAFYHH